MAGYARKGQTAFLRTDDARWRTYACAYGLKFTQGRKSCRVGFSWVVVVGDQVDDGDDDDWPRWRFLMASNTPTQVQPVYAGIKLTQRLFRVRGTAAWYLESVNPARTTDIIVSSS